MVTKCVKCQRHLAEYTSPDHWCRYCWVSWWISSFKTRSKSQRDRLRRECLAVIAKANGKPSEVEQ